jgi:hypothetical protein
MFLSDNRTENTHLLHEETITLEIITNVREMDPNGDIEAFCYFFDHLVPCVAGQKGLDKERRGKQIDIGGKKGGIRTGRSVHRFSLEKLLDEVE